jgi:vWA-MoxR associated protein C-terminal domain/Caspase domain
MSHPDDQPQRYLIAIGSPHCLNTGSATLERVDGDIQEVERLFTRPEQGFNPELKDLRLGSTSSSIKTTLSTWFADDDRRPSDCVVIYYAGHGTSAGSADSHYLLTVESKLDNLANTAIKTIDLVDCCFPGTRAEKYPQNILLILDTCHAGAGGQEIQKYLSEFNRNSKAGSGFWIISSADANTLAGDGSFVEALEYGMNANHPIHQGSHEFTSIGSLVGAINEFFENNNKTQRAVQNNSQLRMDPTFIRNPNFCELSKQLPDVTQLLSVLNKFDIQYCYEAYRQAYPEYGNQLPSSVKSILSVLIGLPNGKEKRLSAFIFHLFRDESISNELRGRLQPWIGNYELPETEGKEYCLMVKVFESKTVRDRYEISAVRYKGVEFLYAAANLKNSWKFDVEESKSLFARSQISEMVVDLIQQCIKTVPPEKLTIQCFFERSLLNLAIEQEEIEYQRAQAVIGSICKLFLLRSLERYDMQTKLDPKYMEGNWSDRWSILMSGLDSNCDNMLVFEESYNQFFSDIKKKEKVGAVFVSSADVKENGEQFRKVISYEGMPIAVWVRPEHNSPNPHAILDSFKSVPIGELPGTITDRRERADRCRASEQDKLFRHVALLWDNPNQPFLSPPLIQT